MGEIFIMMKKFFKRTTDTNLDLNKEVIEYLNAIVKLDRHGDIINYNQVFEKLYGYNENESFFDTVLKNNSLKVSKYFENAISGKTQVFESIGFPKNGKPIDITITLIPIKNKTSNDVYVILNNNTEYQKRDKELNKLYKLREVFDEINFVCSFYYDAINDYFHFSKQFTNIFKISTEKPITPSLNHLLRYVHPDDVDRVKDTVQTALNDRVGFQIEYRVVLQDQSILVLYEKAEILLDKKGNLDGLVGYIQDITDHKMSDDLVKKENHIKMFYDYPEVGIWTIDFVKGEYGKISKGIEIITGYTQEDFKSISWKSIVFHEDLQHYLVNQRILSEGKILKHQYRIVHKNGSVIWIQDYTIPTLDDFGNIIRLEGLVSDITEQMKLKEKVQYLANYDLLTELPNRYKFMEKLEQVLSKYVNSNNYFSVMKLDIDGFKYINDTLGNDAGDELLKLFSKRLEKQITVNDIVARRGGDEFMILVENIKSVEELKIKIHQIIKSINEPFYINGYELYVTASIGISTFPENGQTSKELLRNAGLALQYSKKEGKNNYYILSHSSSIQSYKNFIIGRDLKKAIEDREMVLYFQPQVDSYTNKIIGAEALIRWNHHEWGLISPYEFLTIAEENGLITAIDDWVLQEVCSQIKKWKEQGLQIVPISVNISAIHFMKPNWINEVNQIIRDAGIQPNDLEFEITESTILNNSEVVKNTIDSLKKIGIKISLDDFGTGYSSLSYLAQFPFDVIKLDKSFIRNMFYSDQDMHLIKSIIYMAKGLNLRVVAEGVETIQQLRILQQQQCYEVQGYLFSQPVPVNEFETILRSITIEPIDPKQKAEARKRKHYRLNFPQQLEADIKLVSIAGRKMELGVSKVLIGDISIGGLKFISNLKLPIRGDVVYQFETELLNEPVTLKGSIVWKDEINEDLVEYGIQFISENNGQAALSTLLDTFINLTQNSNALPSYRKVNVDMYQYFK